MSKHILNVFRKFVISTAFKSLPLRSASPVEPEPVRAPLHPERDAWLFAAPRKVSEHMADYAGQMNALAGTLGRLHSVVSKVSANAPMAVASQAEAAFGAVWSDDDLFDGEPLVQAEEWTGATCEQASFLFEDVAPTVQVQVLFQEDVLAA